MNRTHKLGNRIKKKPLSRPPQGELKAPSLSGRESFCEGAPYGNTGPICPKQCAFCTGNKCILHGKLTVSLGKHKLKLLPSECKIIRMGCPFLTFCGKEHAPANQTAVPILSSILTINVSPKTTQLFVTIQRMLFYERMAFCFLDYPAL